MEKRMVKAEGFLRLLAMVFAIIGACLVRFDEETKLVYAVLPMTATYKNLASLRVFVIIQIITGAYNFIQLLRCIIFEIYVALPAGSKNSLCVSFLFDQVVAYACLAVTSAVTQSALIAVTGADSFHWSKLCNIFTKFCVQIGGGIIFGLIAAVLMAILSSIAAYRLFRIYSSKRLFILKRTP